MVFHFLKNREDKKIPRKMEKNLMLFGNNQIILQLFFFINTNNHCSLICMFWIMNIRYNGKMPWILNCSTYKKTRFK
jgi:hypothetical protein